jgi:hypothetical protein
MEEFQVQKAIRESQISIDTASESVMSNYISPTVDSAILTHHPYKRFFQPTPYQLEIANSFLPSLGEEDHVIPVTEVIQTQMIALYHPIPLHHLQHSVNKVCTEYNVLTTTVYRNEKILDADVQFFVDFTPYLEVPPTKYVEFCSLSLNPSVPVAMQLEQKKQQWIQSFSGEKQFGVLVVDAQASDYKQFILFGASSIIVDEFSLSWITKRILSLGEHMGSSHTTNLEEYKSEEMESYEDYSVNCVRSRNDLPFWKNQCIQVHEEQLEIRERKQLELQLKTLEKERINLKNSLISATKRKQDCEKELATLRQQRIALEKELNGDGPVAKFTDPVTGEINFVSQQTKNALVKTVLGDEVTGDNVLPLLEKHDVSKEVQRKIRAQELNLEEFGAISEASVESLNLSTRDKRQILALAEYVGNRIKECIQEQGKVKFTLERKISKASRDLQNASDTLAATKRRYDGNEDMSYRLQNILHPPLEEKKIAPLLMNTLYDTVKAKSEFEAINPWGLTRYVVTNEILDNLRKFRNDWTMNIRNKRKKQRLQDGYQSSDNESLLESDQDEESLKAKTERNMKQSVDAVVLAAFGVLMKHICGNEVFLIGCKTHFRSNENLVGPYSDILPVKLDFSRKGMSFSSLFTSLYRVFKQLKRHGNSCPSSYLAKTLQCELDFKVQFEFINQQELEEYKNLGFTVEELLAPHDIQYMRKCDRLWSSNPADKFDIRFVFVETEDQLECAVRYRQDRFDSDRIAKWVLKFQSTLEGIDCSRRKLSVSSMISRLS